MHNDRDDEPIEVEATEVETVELEPIDEVAPAYTGPDDGVPPAALDDDEGEIGSLGMRDLVVEHPFLAVGAAIAAGFVIGRTLRGV
jgi:hypothetical protein